MRVKSNHVANEPFKVSTLYPDKPLPKLTHPHEEEIPPPLHETSVCAELLTIKQMMMHPQQTTVGAFAAPVKRL